LQSIAVSGWGNATRSSRNKEKTFLRKIKRRSFPGGTSFLPNGGSEVSPPLLGACSCTQNKASAKTVHLRTIYIQN